MGRSNQKMNSFLQIIRRLKQLPKKFFPVAKQTRICKFYFLFSPTCQRVYLGEEGFF